MAVPEVLLSGNHARIAAWREAEAERLTRERRPDLGRGEIGMTGRARQSSLLAARSHQAPAGAEGSTMERLAEVAREGLRTDIPAFDPGDTVRVMVRVHEGERSGSRRSRAW